MNTGGQRASQLIKHILQEHKDKYSIHIRETHTNKITKLSYVQICNALDICTKMFASACVYGYLFILNQLNLQETYKNSIVMVEIIGTLGKFKQRIFLLNLLCWFFLFHLKKPKLSLK